MTSDARPTEAFVWIWLPGKTEPVVAGRLAAIDDRLMFNYGRSYLKRDNRVPIYLPELPLRAGVLPLLDGLTMPSCLRDAAPDAWGRRVILNRSFGSKRNESDAASIDELTYLLQSGSDRMGALDFQVSATDYVAREAMPASLAELMNATASVEKGLPLTPELDRALLHGTSIGGARPKATVASRERKFIAKFSSQNDLYSVVKAEFVAMRLAAESGLNVAPVTLEHTAGRDVLLVERFDRQLSEHGWERRAVVSALTLLGLDEMMARYASYAELATIIRHRFTAPKQMLRELFGRMLFNVLCGNTDDHARNHAAFWDGRSLALTPAYDICPQSRTGGEATQAMLIAGDRRWSRISLCLDAAPLFLVSAADALAMATRQVATIRDLWGAVCTEARLSEVDRNLLWRRQFLNSFAFEGAPPALAALVA